MSMTVVCKDASQQLCTASGLFYLGQWIKTLPEDRYGELRQLHLGGFSENCTALASQLADAIDSQPDKSADVMRTAGVLNEFVQQHKDQHVIWITDGTPVPKDYGKRKATGRAKAK